MQIWEPPQAGKLAVGVPERLLVHGKGFDPQSQPRLFSQDAPDL